MRLLPNDDALKLFVGAFTAASTARQTSRRAKGEGRSLCAFLSDETKTSPPALYTHLLQCRSLLLCMVLSTCMANLCTCCLAAVVGKKKRCTYILSKSPIETTCTRRSGALYLEVLSLERPNVGKNTEMPLRLWNPDSAREVAFRSIFSAAQDHSRPREYSTPWQF